MTGRNSAEASTSSVRPSMDDTQPIWLKTCYISSGYTITSIRAIAAGKMAGPQDCQAEGKFLTLASIPANKQPDHRGSMFWRY